MFFFWGGGFERLRVCKENTDLDKTVQMVRSRVAGEPAASAEAAAVTVVASAAVAAAAAAAVASAATQTMWEERLQLLNDMDLPPPLP